jgi:hypothetical protein
LISSYSESELEVIVADVFERFAGLWDQEREKLQIRRQDSKYQQQGLRE